MAPASDEPTLLSDGSWRLDLGPGAALEWRGCPACMAPTPCGIWLDSGRRTCQVDPCRCDEVDDRPPAWLVQRAERTGEIIYRCRPYIPKKGKWAGRWHNYCPCWGRQRDGMDAECCAWHDWNPAYVPPGAMPELPPGFWDGVKSPHDDLRDDLLDEFAAGWRAPHERSERDTDFDWDHHSGEIEHRQIEEPYHRRWPAVEVTCACPTPWDGMLTKDGQVDARKVGYHCVSCHHNFRSLSAAGPHQRGLVCRAPGSILDAERGTRVYRATDDGVFVIWG